MEETNWTSFDLYYKGFHVKKSVPDNVKLSAIKKTIDKALDLGFEPSWNADTNKQATSSPQPKDVPLCSIHQAPMSWKTGVSKTTNKPYAFWACSQKNPDGSFCKGKPVAKMSKEDAQMETAMEQFSV